MGRACLAILLLAGCARRASPPDPAASAHPSEGPASETASATAPWPQAKTIRIDAIPDPPLVIDLSPENDMPVVLDVGQASPALRYAVKTTGGAEPEVALSFAPPGAAEATSLSSKARELPRAGRYGIRVTSAQGKVSVIVFGEGTRAPLGLLAPLPGSATLEDRQLLVRYPWLLENDLESLPIVEELFASAPAELFVFSRGKLQPGASGPLANEPLLWARTTAIAADGKRYGATAEDVLTEPAGPIGLPRAPRFTTEPDGREAAQPAVPAELQEKQAEAVRGMIACTGDTPEVTVTPGCAMLEREARRLTGVVEGLQRGARASALERARRRLTALFPAKR